MKDSGLWIRSLLVNQAGSTASLTRKCRISSREGKILIEPLRYVVQTRCICPDILSFHMCHGNMSWP